MISISEGTALMGYSLAASKNILIESGYMNPTLYIFNTKKEIKIRKTLFGSAVSTVVQVSHIGNDTVFKYDSLTKDDIYLTMVTFKFQELKDADNIQEIINTIVTTHNPDMVGVVIAALFRSFSEKEKEHIPKSVLDDPSAVRILHSFFYTKKGEKAIVQNTPFVNRGELPEGKKSSEVNYDMTFIDSGWVEEDKENVPRFQNPYNVGDKNAA